MIEAFKAYFEQIKRLDVKDATEHTLRPALDNLLKALAGEKIKVIHEPKRDPTGKGAPDFKFKLNECILGYLENKKIGENLDQYLRSEQIAKYKQLSGNLILTNYLEWIWLKDGAILKRETLCYPSDVGYLKACLDRDKGEKVAGLIAAFLSTPPKGIGRAKDLALALAIRCHELREFLTEELIRQEREHQQGKLIGLFGVFQKDVFHELDIAGFADAFAQMLGYGLFLARLNNGNAAPLSLRNAKQFIPANFELIRELVDFLDELDKEEYRQIRWLVEEILSIMNTLDLAALQEDLAFSKRQGRFFVQTEEERLLFAKDPYVYFYEGFLKAYDKDMRKSRGVYYTPPPVVNFIVRSVNDILKSTFGIKDGLADRKRVTVLDFATGTGTFLLEVLQLILDATSEGLRDQLIREHALKNFFGFEYLIAPYTIAHLKLSQFLHDKGYNMQPDERLQIYLTNTLEPIEPQANWLLPALSKEVESAQEVKNKKILVITGNPPYSGISLNRGEWISKLIDTYKWVDSKPFGEKKHWLNDDYVKFIRFAQWKMEQVDEGIVGIITNHSFLDNPTFRGMRQSLMQTFNRMYFLDLHGSTKRKETTPEDGKDENVFDIEQGVCISLFVRKQGLERKISHDDLWGKRKEKYRACMEYEIANMAWKNLSPKSPFYFFKPRDESGIDVYNSYFPITEIFQTYSIGVQTSRDSLAVAIQRGELEQRIKEFIDQSKSTEEIIKKFKLKNTRGWTPQYSRDIISKIDNWKSFITPYEYRPFDCRYVYYHPQMVDWPRFAIMNNFIKDNIALLAPRQLATDYYRHAFVSDKICDMCLISTLTKEQNRVFPLYQYNLYDDKKHKTRQFEETDPFSGKERIENFTPEFRRRIDNKYDHCYGSEEIFGYIYAILNNITYRRKYIEFLKIDFPKIPLVDNPETFERLSALGWQLVQAHLLLDIPESLKVDLTRGNDAVEKPVYVATQQRLYINDEQYFSPVPDDVWSFHIGCYQVMDKYLRYRKGRELSLDEKENIMNVVKVLRFTIDLMQEIDEIWKP